jgi:uncharacterized C2H2 Zn-finger protein
MSCCYIFRVLYIFYRIEMVSLRFGDFPQHAVNTVKSLFNDSNSCDVTLTCGSESRVSAHKFMLSKASPVFENILSECPVSTPFIYLRGFEYEDVSAIIRYIYLGEVNIAVENMDRFLATAKELKIEGLTNQECPNSDEIHQMPKLELKPLSKLQRSEAEITQSTDEATPYFHRVNNFETQKDPNRFLCGQCVSSFNNKATLQHHINKEHLKIRYICETCNQYETHSPAALKKHKANEHGQLNAMLQCPKCDYKSPKASKLKEHILNIHEGARYPCVQCSYIANSYGNLQSHKKSQHNGIRYPCELCNHRSTRKQYLKKHMEKAHNYKPRPKSPF